MDVVQPTYFAKSKIPSLLQDNVIPYSPESPDNLGEGPDMTTLANEGYYYHIKPDHLNKVKYQSRLYTVLGLWSDFSEKVRNFDFSPKLVRISYTFS